MIYYFILLIVAFLCFFLGYFFGKNKTKNEPFEQKVYRITFEKQSINGKKIKSSYIVNKMVNFCDSLGIDIVKFEMDDVLDCVLEVKCTKDQHFLIIQELSKNEYMIEISNLTF